MAPPTRTPALFFCNQYYWCTAKRAKPIIGETGCISRSDTSRLRIMVWSAGVPADFAFLFALDSGYAGERLALDGFEHGTTTG